MAATLREAFKEAGYVLTNPHLQWSCVSPDGKKVAVFVWADEIDKSAEPWQFDCRGHPNLGHWINKPGNALRMTHLRHALQACGGRVDLILCKAADPKAANRKVAAAKFWAERYGLIQPGELNEETGEFRLQLLPKAA